MRKIGNVFGETYSKRLSYIRELYANEDELLKNIRLYGEANDRPININPEEGKLLQVLIKLHKPKVVIEIGTLYGYSTIWMVRAIENGEIYTIDRQDCNIEKAEQNFAKLENNLGKKINLIHGDAQEVLKNLNVQADMLFIDADKINYLNYLNWAENGGVRKGGLVVADNVMLSGAVYMDSLPERVRITAKNNMIEFNKRLANPEKYESIILNTEEGLSISIVV